MMSKSLKLEEIDGIRRKIDEISQKIGVKMPYIYFLKLATVYFSKGELKKSLEMLNLAEKDAPSVPEIWLNKAEILQRLGKNQDAVEYYKKYFDFYPGANEFFKGPLIEQILTRVRSVSWDSFIILRSINDYLITREKNRFDLFFEYLYNIEPTKGDPVMQIENMITFDICAIVGGKRSSDLIDLKNLLNSSKKLYYTYKKIKKEEDVDINQYVDPNIWRDGKELGKIILSEIKKKTL